VGAVFRRRWQLVLASMEVVLAAALITRAVTEGGWYWWAGAILLAMLALLSLFVDLRTERKRRRPSDP
jgi:hypothetical protein